MKPGVISFASPEIERVLSGKLTFFRRLASGVLKDAKPGRQLWLREPFYLPPQFDDENSTTRALDRGAKPTFACDPTPAPGTALGRLRAGRFLCRDWHRFHVVISDVEPQRLQDITDEEVEAMGYQSRLGFREMWDSPSNTYIASDRWANNPHVLRFGFKLVRSPVPAEPRTKAENSRAVKNAERLRKADERRAAWAREVEAELVRNRAAEEERRLAREAAKPPPPIVAPPPAPTYERSLAHAGKSSTGGQVRLSAPAHLVGACERCGVRFAVGCEHYPKEELVE